MAQCMNCKNQIPDDSTFCPICGAAVNAKRPYQDQGYAPQPDPSYRSQYRPVVPAHDHTAEFNAEDISENKVYCMLPYLLSYFGIIIALMGAKDSAYAKFHIRQAMKYCVVELLLGIVTAALCWTIIVPIISGLALTVLSVLKIITFFEVCSGKAVEPILIRDLKFLK